MSSSGRRLLIERSFQHSQSNRTQPQLSAIQIAPEMLPLKPLPPPMLSKPPPTARDAFPVPITLNLLHPSAIERMANSTTGNVNPVIADDANVVCSQSTAAFISSTHSFEQIAHQLLVTAATSFGLGLDEMNRQRYWYALVVEAGGIKSVMNAENKAFIVDMSRGGGWCWTLHIVECEQNARGVWESVTPFMSAQSTAKVQHGSVKEM